MKNTKKIGDLGEDLACRYLKNMGFRVVDRNYRKFFGEIDIIAQKSGKVFFFEVKTVSRDFNIKDRESLGTQGDSYRPEDNLHPAKIAKLVKTIGYYVLENKLLETVWQLDGITVLLDVESRKAKIKRIENIVI